MVSYNTAFCVHLSSERARIIFALTCVLVSTLGVLFNTVLPSSIFNGINNDELEEKVVIGVDCPHRINGVAEH